MLKKQNGKSKAVKVTFSLPKDVQAETACLVGDFNNWDEKATPMKKDGEGAFSTTISLDKGREYQFRYLVNGSEWHNDWQADKYIQNTFGGDNSVVTT
jgi:1,4-alpha-glucan branching enzyme